LESSLPAGSYFKANNQPPLQGAPPPSIVSSALPPATIILAELLDFSCALQAIVVSPL
jgi:hypothetical protein